MSWLGRFLRRPPALAHDDAAALAAYRAQAQPDLNAALAAQRVVVVDVESSGLDPFHDRLISVAGIAVRGGLVRLDESFEAVLRQEQPSDDRNILVHGIGGSAQLEGRQPAGALTGFLTFAGKDPLIAFHADFDRILIERATASALSMKPENVWLDLALLAPALFPDRAETARVLDDWLRVFGIENHARHDALADALATAQLLLAALAAAESHGLAAWADLVRLQKDHRWLAASGRVV
jgi:DNA polymerase-3 subunit epsilon